MNITTKLLKEMIRKELQEMRAEPGMEHPEFIKVENGVETPIEQEEAEMLLKLPGVVQQDDFKTGAKIIIMPSTGQAGS